MLKESEFVFRFSERGNIVSYLHFKYQYLKVGRTIISSKFVSSNAIYPIAELVIIPIIFFCNTFIVIFLGIFLYYFASVHITFIFRAMKVKHNNDVEVWYSTCGLVIRNYTFMTSFILRRIRNYNLRQCSYILKS